MRLILLLLSLICAAAAPARGGEKSFDCVMNPSLRVNLASQIPGLLDQVLVERGDHVHKQQVVARLTSEVEAAQVDARPDARSEHRRDRGASSAANAGAARAGARQRVVSAPGRDGAACRRNAGASGYCRARTQHGGAGPRGGEARIGAFGSVSAATRNREPDRWDRGGTGDDGGRIRPPGSHDPAAGERRSFICRGVSAGAAAN